MSYRVDILGKAAYTKLMSEYSSVLIFYEMYGQPQMASSHSFKFVRKRNVLEDIVSNQTAVVCLLQRLLVFFPRISGPLFIFPLSTPSQVKRSPGGSRKRWPFHLLVFNGFLTTLDEEEERSVSKRDRRAIMHQHFHNRVDIIFIPTEAV